jgi:hypothetical protein
MSPCGICWAGTRGSPSGQPAGRAAAGSRIGSTTPCVGHGKHQDYKRWAEGKGGDLAAEPAGSGVPGHEESGLLDQFGVPLGGPVGQRAGVGAVGPVGYCLKREGSLKGAHVCGETFAGLWATSGDLYRRACSLESD